MREIEEETEANLKRKRLLLKVKKTLDRWKE